MAAFALLNEFDFVAFGRVNEGEGCAAGTRRRAIGEFHAEFFQMLRKFVEAVHLERQMGEVGLDRYGAAAREVADFNFLIAFRRLEKNQFGAARRFVPLDFLEAEDVAIEFHGALQIVHAVARVQQFCDLAHIKFNVQSPIFKVERIV